MREYERMLPEAMTGFSLPESHHETAIPIEIACTSSEIEEIERKLRLIPFPCIRILRKQWSGVRPGLYDQSDTICRSEGGEFRWSSRDVFASPERRTVVFHPEDVPISSIALPRAYFDLIEALSDRKNGYLETLVSRQVRRAEGLAATYRQYIVVRRREVGNALTLAAVIRRHPVLHAVRGHLRQYQSGKVAFVRPHTRGKGDMVQVKDYLLA